MVLIDLVYIVCQPCEDGTGVAVKVQVPKKATAVRFALHPVGKIFLILLVLAFARPFIPSSTVASAHGSRTLALCIDDSFSMKQGGRLEQARQDAGPDRHDQRQGSAEGGRDGHPPNRYGEFLC